MSPPPQKKTSWEKLTGSTKKGAKEECPCFLGLDLKGKKKLGVGVEKVQETRLVNVQLVSPNHTA